MSELGYPAGGVDIGLAVGSPPINTVVVIGRGVATESNTFVVAWGDPPVQVSIRSDGKIDLPPGWKPDEAAQEFWRGLGNAVRGMVGLMPFGNKDEGNET